MNKHEDERGIIEDLKVGKDWSVTYISFKKGAVRGNHLHRATIQLDIIISGRLECVTKRRFFKWSTRMFGYDIKWHFPGTQHAYKALSDSEMVSICFGKRIGENYEEDTFRLTEKEKLL